MSKLPLVTIITVFIAAASAIDTVNVHLEMICDLPVESYRVGYQLHEMDNFKISMDVGGGEWGTCNSNSCTVDFETKWDGDGLFNDWYEFIVAVEHNCNSGRTNQNIWTDEIEYEVKKNHDIRYKVHLRSGVFEKI